MPQPAHSISRFRFATIYLTVAAALLVTAYLAVLEWRQAHLCREFRSVAIAAKDHFFFIWPWIIMVVCQLATMRRARFGVIFYASFVLALIVVVLQIDELVISPFRGTGLWMPDWLFCDQWNWFDFELGIGLLTGFIVAPFAGALGLATATCISVIYVKTALRQESQ